MICPNIHRLNLFRELFIIRETEVRLTGKRNKRIVQGGGFITKEGIFIILNIGLITALIRAASLSE